jgi:uncharacterized protein with beta-barrel porin domain
VTVATGGSITTFGAGAWGILAQSIGGGGGFSGDPSLPLAAPSSNTLPRTGNGNAFANTVSVTVDGNITTTGANAHGIFAQAIGGSGGIAAGCCNSTAAYAVAGNTAQIRGSANAAYWGDGGAINIVQGAGSTIRTSGSGSIAIFAQSSGNSAAVNAITVTLGGAVIGGTNSGVTEGVGAAGILLSGGGGGANPNTVTINPGASLGTVDGVNGVAIITTSGDTNLINNGTLTGSTNMDTDPSTIVNNGVFHTGSIVIANSVTNTGVVDVLGRGVIGTTQLVGDYAQGGTGLLAIDVDALAAQTADLLAVSGTARLGGAIVPAARTLLPGTYDVLTAGSLSLAGLSARQALLFGWDVATRGASVALSPRIDLTPAGVSLSRSQVSLAGYLTTAWNQSDRFFAPLFGYQSQIATASQYVATENALSGRATQALPAELENAAQDLLGAALSCPVFVDQATLLGEDSCAWARFTGGWVNHGSDGSDPGYNVDGTTYRLGAQKALAPGWYLGGSLGVGQDWAQAQGSSSHGDRYDGTIAVKHTLGPWLFAGSIALANEAFSTDRVVNLPAMGTASGYNAVLTSDSSVFLAGGRARAAYEFSFGQTYLRPYGDLDVVHTHAPGFQESGAANLALTYAATDTTSVVLSPMLELGGRYDLRDRLILRPYLDSGVSFRPDNSRTVAARFSGGLNADGTFQTTTNSPDVIANIAVGAQLYRAGGFEARAEYGLHAGQSYLAQTASARFAYHF